MHPKVAAGMIVPDDNLGVLLLDFLQLYGVQFNIGHVGISIVGSGSYYNQVTQGNTSPRRRSLTFHHLLVIISEACAPETDDRYFPSKIP